MEDTIDKYINEIQTFIGGEFVYESTIEIKDNSPILTFKYRPLINLEIYNNPYNGYPMINRTIIESRLDEVRKLWFVEKAKYINTIDTYIQVEMNNYGEYILK